ncbi:hypothetical protein R3P82_12660 [Dietzia maris]|uniref:Capsid maturation protease n=1 Tax=Dietzia maris TaxID=37915 RepID=A0AAE4R2T6_9ACTN|nr:hypothetical protein [Dietzia maris]MDV6299961.1 hypothetical protein [Dietzia maris]
MPRLDQVESFREQLDDLNRAQVARLIQLWSRLIGRPDDYVRDALVAEFPQLVDVFAGAASDLTAEWYDSLAATEAFRARPAPLPPPDQLESSTRWAAAALASGTTTSPVERLAGTAQRALFNASRQTVELNVEREGAGWARYASANACEFCRMLATRGSVYGSKAAATSVVGRGRAGRTRGNQSLGSTYHDHCRCMAVPVRAGDTYEPPGYVEDWAAQYTQARAAADGVGTKSILAAWRQLS